MKILVDNIWTYFDGAFPRGILDPVTSYLKDGRWFVKAFKAGHWDGRVRFIEYDRKRQLYRVPTGFLIRCLEALDQHGYPYTLYDDRELEPAEPVYTLSGSNGSVVDLRHGKWSYQSFVLDQALKHTRGILKLATGGGKTEIGAAIIASVGPPAVWLTHRQNLMYQTHRRLTERLGCRIGLVGDGICDLEPISVVMVQTLAMSDKPGYERLRDFLREPRLIIGDEVHHLESDQWFDNFSKINAGWRFGLTATPSLEGPGLALLAQTGSIIVDINAFDLIERGVLVPPRIWFYKINSKKIPKSRNYQQVYKEGIVENTDRNEAIAEIANVFKLERKPALTLCKRIGHGELLTDLLNYRKIKTEFVRGSVKQEDREKILRRLKLGQIDHVVAIAETMAEGADYPFLRALINATGSRGGGAVGDEEVGRTTIQILGRIIRGSSGKTYADYVDFVDTCHKSILEASLSRIGTLESQGYAPFINYWQHYKVEAIEQAV